MAQAISEHEFQSAPPGSGAFAFVIVTLATAVLAVQTVATLESATFINVVTLCVLVVLFLLVHLQIILLRWSGGRSIRRLLARLAGSAYISEIDGLPNRNFMLAELRREMPRSRKHREPFMMAVFSLHDIEGMRRRRGDDYIERATRALGTAIRRRVRSSDFAAHLGDSSIGVLLFDCEVEGLWRFLERIPRHIGVSDGRQMYDVPLDLRTAEYDMESIYASDVLRAAEEAEPAVRIDPAIHWSQLA